MSINQIWILKKKIKMIKINTSTNNKLNNKNNLKNKKFQITNTLIILNLLSKHINLFFFMFFKNYIKKIELNELCNHNKGIIVNR